MRLWGQILRLRGQILRLWGQIPRDRGQILRLPETLRLEEAEKQGKSPCVESEVIDPFGAAAPSTATENINIQ